MTFSLLYKGFAYVAFYNGAYENFDSPLSLVQTGANSIEATLDYGIDVATSEVVADSNYTDSLAALGSTIDQAENLGLTVMVRPLIDFLDPAVIAPYSVGDWRQNYQPTNVATFFASYKQMILAQAQVAQQHGAQMLSIGAELDQLAGPQYLSYWTDIISSVRAVFSGKLTYSASWNTAGSVSFWSQLDYQGIDCYVPLTNTSNPTLQDLVNGWLTAATQATNPDAFTVIGSQSPIQYFENLAAQSGKPLLFTELGYANDTGAAANPSASGSSPDPTLQANLYKAFFEAWAQSGSSSLIGTYFWEWDPNGSTSNVGPAVDSFSPQNDPAQSAATAGFETVMSGQTLTVSSGQTSNGIVVQSGGILDVVSGGTISNTVDSGGGLIVSAGGSAVSTTIDGGSAGILSGGTANGAVISGGTLELYGGAATGSDPTVFAGSSATLRIDSATMPVNVISGFAVGDTIDLAGVGFSAGGMAGLAAGNVLQVVAGGQTYGLQLDPSANFAGDFVRLSSDGHGGTDVSLSWGFSINVTYDFERHLRRQRRRHRGCGRRRRSVLRKRFHQSDDAQHRCRVWRNQRQPDLGDRRCHEQDQPHLDDLCGDNFCNVGRRDFGRSDRRRRRPARRQSDRQRYICDRPFRSEGIGSAGGLGQQHRRRLCRAQQRDDLHFRSEQSRGVRPA